jgi:hypothetical protein
MVWGKPQKPSIWIAGITVEFRATHVPKTSLECYHCTNLITNTIWKSNSNVPGVNYDNIPLRPHGHCVWRLFTLHCTVDSVSRIHTTYILNENKSGRITCIFQGKLFEMPRKINKNLQWKISIPNSKNVHITKYCGYWLKNIGFSGTRGFWCNGNLVVI